MAKAETERRDGAQALVERLRERREEIEQSVLTRVSAVDAHVSVTDPEYALGLRAAARAATCYGIDTLVGGAMRPAPIPVELLSQARSAARSGVGLEVVLRRYAAGYALLGDFIVEEAAALERGGQALCQHALRAEAGALDAVLDAVAAEYKAEREHRVRFGEQRRGEGVRRLLAGETADLGSLDYELERWHVGAIATGREARTVLKALVSDLDLRSLFVAGDEGAIWAWLGATRHLDCASIASHAATALPEATTLCLGEPARELAGWRLTHHQAAATLTVARRRPPGVTRYQEVLLLTSLLQDEVLLSSLQDLYLAPLAAARGGLALRETLEAYFAAGRNIASAASSLGVARQTAASRLRTVEERLGRPLADCAVELEMALALQELSR